MCHLVTLAWTLPSPCCDVTFLIFKKTSSPLVLIGDTVENPFPLRPYSHTIFLHTILRWKDKKTLQHLTFLATDFYWITKVSSYKKPCLPCIMIWKEHTLAYWHLWPKKYLFYCNIFLSQILWAKMSRVNRASSVAHSLNNSLKLYSIQGSHHLGSGYQPYRYDIGIVPECAYTNKHYYNLTFCLQDDYYPT